MAAEQNQVRAVLHGEVLFEEYLYPPGKAQGAAPHAHAEYLFCLSPNFPGEYRYRHARHPVPVGSLSVLHPGEVHSSRDLSDRSFVTRFLALYIPTTLMTEAAQSLGAATRRTLPAEPFFAEPIYTDSLLASRFAQLFRAGFSNRPTRLLRDELLLAALAALLHDDAGGVRGRGRFERAGVRRVREYLDQCPQENCSLEILAQIAGLSSYHLSHVFRAEVGLSPHAYQVQARVMRAKRLLASGIPTLDAAQQSGFHDSSHLSRHFKRLIGVTPARFVSARTYQIGV